MKKISFLLVALLLTAVVNAQTVTTQKHETQSGETLYSLARQYNVTVAYLLELNPGLEADHIMAGQKINVPAQGQQPAASNGRPAAVTNGQQTAAVQTADVTRPKYKTMHEVQKKETIYSISRQYGITIVQLIDANPYLKDEKLKKGAVLNIPYSDEENRTFVEQQRVVVEEVKKPVVQMYSTIKVAVILPFSLSESKMSAESQKMTNLYQGFLLAVDSLKQKGCSVEVFAYDELMGEDAFINLMRKPSMKEMQLIVGPIRPYHVNTVAKFAHDNNIVHVVPLSDEVSMVNGNPTLFQVNIPYTQLYGQVYNRFVVDHRADNIIFVNMNAGDNVSYVSGFKKALGEMGIQFQSVDMADVTSLRTALSAEKRNVIISSSDAPAAFENLCKKLDGMNLGPEYSMQLFGYPKWQTFRVKYAKHLFKYRCQFFTSFYSNNDSYRTQQFNSRFRRWFNQDQYNSFPKYGELGYDVGVYFLKGLKEFGSSFYENIHNFAYTSLEFPFNFEKQSVESGYQNRALYIVTYKTDGLVSVR